jgi:hypothetical protein
MGETVPEGDDVRLDARAAFAQLIAIADRARQMRQHLEKCTTLDVDGVLKAYAVTRTLCNGLTCGEEPPISIPDLGRIAEDKHYPSDKLRAILIGVEVECFKGIGALGKAIALIPKEEKPRK